MRFFRKDRTFEVNKLFIVWLLAWLLHAVIDPWELRENDALVLANQGARVISATNASHIIITLNTR